MSEYSKTRMVCLGSVELVNATHGIGFTVIDEDNKLTNRHYYFKKNKNVYKNAGQIYEVSAGNEGIEGKFEWVGQLSDYDQEKSKDIQLLSAIVETKMRNISSEKKQAKDNKSNLFNCLLPLRNAYYSTDSAGKIALIAQVISHMQRKL